MRKADSTSDGSTPDPDSRIETTACDPAEGSRARRLIVERLKAWGCNRIIDIALVLSELVTNAVMHAGGAVLISVSRTTDKQHVRLEVHDNVTAQPLPRNNNTGLGGLGLRIVDQLSEQWGTSPTPTGKLVWAIIRT